MGPPSCSSISCWAFDQPAYRLADLAARPNTQLFHRLLDAFDLNLRLLELDPIAQGLGGRLTERPLHTLEGLLLGAISVLQFLG